MLFVHFLTSNFDSNSLARSYYSNKMIRILQNQVDEGAGSEQFKNTQTKEK